jgi:Lrp/AsnC family transcriptional regulator for asnA, asnC and gidA
MDNVNSNLGNIEIDDVDKYIIEAMRQDGRIAFAQIAEQLNVSPGMIRVRYNRMVKQGLIKVVAITNPLNMGYSAMTMIGIRTDGERLLEVARLVAAFDEVIYLIVVSGRFDIIAEVVCRDHNDLLKFLTEKLYKVNGVRESETFVHLKIEKEIYY